jgi:hypothetical protein
MQYLSCWDLNRCVPDTITGTDFHSSQGIVIDNVIESNLFNGHKHDKKIYVIKRFVINVLWKGIISYLWVHARARLNVLWKGNIVFLWVLKTILFQWLWATLILFDYETHCIGKIIFLSFHAYKERPNQRSYTLCALI